MDVWIIIVMTMYLMAWALEHRFTPWISLLRMLLEITWVVALFFSFGADAKAGVYVAVWYGGLRVLAPIIGETIVYGVKPLPVTDRRVQTLDVVPPVLVKRRDKRTKA